MALSLFLLGKVESNKQVLLVKNGVLPDRIPFFTIGTLFIFIIFTFFSGVRWQVGVDHLSYMEQYDYFAKNGVFDRDSFEVGYTFIVSILAGLNFHVIAFFVVFAFLELFFVYYRFKEERYLYPFIGFLIICGPTYLSWMNGMRQWVAAVIFIYATQFILKRSFLKYALCVGLAMCFHKSAAMLFLLYFIPNREIFRNRYINIGLIVGSLIVGSISVWHQSINSIAPLLSFVGYDSYAEGLSVILEEHGREMAFGPRRMITFLLQVLVVYFSPKMVKLFESKGYNLYFNLFMIGIILFNLLANTSHIFLRPIMYFDFFSVILLSYLMYYLSNVNKRSEISFLYWVIIILSIAYLGIVCLSESGAEIDFSNYKFIWSYT